MALQLSDPKVQKKLLAALAPLLLLLGYWYFYHGPQQEEIGELESRLEVLEGRNAAARAKAQGGPEIEKTLALYEEHILQLEKLIPLREEVPELLYDLSLRAQENGVELARLNPNAETPGAYYNLHTYEVAIFGGYHDIGRYLAAVGSLPRIVTPYDVTIQPRQERDRSGAIRLQAEFRIKTYVLPPAESPAL
jgi:type IV pilus assembly protein PilO